MGCDWSRLGSWTCNNFLSLNKRSTFFHKDDGHDEHKDTEAETNNGTNNISTVAILI